MEKMRAVLTDGAETFEVQDMTEEEMQDANAEAMVATDGNLYWAAE
jgi:hypothetical protein